MQNYCVLARKYRPKTFADLKGQETVVRVFENSFKNNRVAHAYLFTGIRGVGKTTTARIIAKSLNCIGEEGGNNKPTVHICNKCTHCMQINEDRHPDVLEIDGASKTSIEDIQEIIEFTRYLPVSSRYKVVIIDEVHMISTKAFNALLKTLEEPPAHVIFIFATTELKKIPITILSRCQKFELRRFNNNEIFEHLKYICGLEKIEYEENALQMISTASEGSVRDSLSLLDQAINHSYENDVLIVKEATVQNLIGRTSNVNIIQLINFIYLGDVEKSVAKLNEIITKGAESIAIIESVMEIVHYMTLMKNKVYSNNSIYLTTDETKTLAGMVEKLSVPVLSRTWSMLIKGIDEIKMSPQQYMALEMLIIRLCHVQAFPTPINLLNNSFESNVMGSAAVSTVTASNPKSFDDVLALLSKYKYLKLLNDIKHYASLISFGDNFIELNLDKFDMHNNGEKSNVHIQLKKFLLEMTGIEWNVIKSEQEAKLTIEEQEDKTKHEVIEKIKEHKKVKALLDRIPDAQIITVYDENTILN